ncbi:MAG: LppX_LprAFG lipoprotein [Candidatus Viridilinea halotolerans]|uniref:LppX_LprAFG lipoprotein n=1 Tax=Candidatus Viridilinea halotolerans TaxID=2491704 RepID=A0A426U0W1_9CHLR|nr:MAG: LppX_LprAFG lipoprotein [Candidatus Viridilinea halotolerans]
MRSFLLIAILFILASCSVANETPQAEALTPRELSAAIGQATLASESVSFALTLSGRPVPLDTSGLMQLNRMQGDLLRPDGVVATLRVILGASAVADLRTISFAGRQYLTNPLTRQWMCLDPAMTFDPAILFAPDQGIEYLLQEGFTDVALVGTEELDGREHYHLRGTLDAAQLQTISLGLLGRDAVSAELWADSTTMQLTRLVLVDGEVESEDATTWTLTFSDYGKTVDVRAPMVCE